MIKSNKVVVIGNNNKSINLKSTLKSVVVIIVSREKRRYRKYQPLLPRCYWCKVCCGWSMMISSTHDNAGWCLIGY